MKLGELFFELGFKSIGKAEASNFDKQIGSLKTKSAAFGKELFKLGSVVTMTSGIITAFTKKMSDAVVNLDKISSLTGMSSDTIQRLGEMAATTGTDINQLSGAVMALQKQSVDISLGRGGNIGVFQFLGLDPHEDPIKNLDKLAIKLQKMPTALGTAMASDLGLSPELIYFLKEKGNLPAANPETILSSSEVKRLKDFNFYFNRIFEQSSRVLQKFAAFLTPIATQVVYFFDRMSSMFGEVLNRLDPVFVKLKKYMPFIVGVGIALFYAFNPLTAIFIGLAIAIEDIYSFFKGEDSILGRILNWVTNIKERVKELIDLFWDLVQFMTIGGDTKYKAWFDEKRKGSAKTGESVEKSLGTIPSKVMRGMGSVQDFFQKNFNIKVEDIPNKGKLPKTSMINNNNNININIEGASDPEETAEVVSRKIQDAFYQYGVMEA